MLTYADEIAALANKTLRAAGFSNKVRVTDSDNYLPSGRGTSGPYVRVNALRA